MKLGSLFDGSGGFPLAGFLCDIEPVWASEIEPYPIAVTKSRFPHVKQLGDISKINGAEIEPVDIITFGSPCQDLSVAGKRAGLKHEDNGDDETTRSGLFMEAVRIIKEMRRATNGKYPRWICWENVPGAFSSNKGEDFKIVLEEIIKIIEPTAVMPEVPRFGWAYADSYVGNGWSLAYRVFDAQYWGVPQRRRRIYLVADFGGECAREILFEREGLRGYFAESGTPWQTAPADAQRGVGTDDRAGEIPYTLKIRSGCEGGGKGALIQENMSATLACNNDQYLFQPTAYGISAYESNSMKSSNPHSGIYKADTSRTLDLNGGNPTCNQGGIAIVEGFDVYNQSLTGDKAKTLTSIKSDADHVPCVVLDDQGGKSQANVSEEMSPTLTCTHGGEPAIAIDRAFFNQGENALYEPQTYADGTVPTLVAKGPGAVCTIGLSGSDISPTLISRMSSAVGTTQDNLIVSEKREDTRYIVRRLTPTECARLQGFADRWGDIDKKTKFSDEEYHFWHDVRNTHAAINGRTVKEYNKKQMLTWYNKLHTDSAEYKMWGNGIALPTALYVMQGIKEVSNENY